MSRIAYVNGRYDRLRDAEVHIEDRGYQFADGIYEVVLWANGRFFDLDAHLARYQRSLDEMQMDAPMSENALIVIIRELIRRNRLKDAMIYIQTTRGVAPRNHAFPAAHTPPALIMTARGFDMKKSDAQAETGVCAITAPDIRWGRVDIKTVSLLPNALAKQAAKEAGASEALLTRGGKITEGTSSNAWMIDKSGALITHPLGHEILGGVTRATIIKCAEELQLKVIERAFSPDEAKSAKEVFISSASSLVMPVIALDGARIGAGAPGPMARRLREAYKAKILGAPA